MMMAAAIAGWLGAALLGVLLLVQRRAARRSEDARYKEVADALREREARLRGIIEAAVDGIITIDARGTIESWNPAAERLFGYRPEEVIGHNVKMLMPQPYQREHDDYLSRYVRTGERRVIGGGREVKGQRRDGTVFPMDLAVSEMRIGDARRGYTGIIRDITDRKRADAERELLLESERAARTEAERAARMKDEFVATVSHELRTPLNAILGWVGMLRKGSLDAKTQARALEVIDRNARSQAQMVEDLLDVSRIVSGKLHLHIQPVDLTETIESAIATVQPVADAKRIRFEKALDPAAGAVLGDPVRLQQVAWNLLSNAVKFTPTGGSVSVSLRPSGTFTELVVSDSGCGIRPDFLPHVFERFRQADASTARPHAGLGLGLSLVRHIAELHGGSVGVHSDGEGRGAAFTVRVPLAPIREDAVVAPSAPAVSDLLAGVKVLVVDDEQDVRDLVRRMLEECGAEVTTVESAEEALSHVQSARPDVLVSDIGMPRQDGYQLLRALRALGPESGGATPAAALTAFARPEDRVRALRAGYQIHMAKPVDASELVTVVASLARRMAA